MLLRLDRVVDGARADDLEAGHPHLVAARGAAVGADLATEGEGRLDGELGEALPDLGGDGALHEHALHDPTSIAEHHERNFPGRAHVGDPPADAGLLADESLQLIDAGVRQCHWYCEGYVAGQARAQARGCQRRVARARVICVTTGTRLRGVLVATRCDTVGSAHAAAPSLDFSEDRGDLYDSRLT